MQKDFAAKTSQDKSNREQKLGESEGKNETLWEIY